MNLLGFDPGPLINSIGRTFDSLPFLSGGGFNAPSVLDGRPDWGNISVAGSGFQGPSLVAGSGFRNPRLVGELNPFGAPATLGGGGGAFGTTVITNPHPFGSGYIPPNIAPVTTVPDPATGGGGTAVPGEGWGSPDAATIEREVAGTRLQGQGATIIAAANEAGVPVSVLMAIMRQETSYQTPAQGTRFNFGGLRNPDGPGFQDFPDLSTGIRAVARNLGSAIYRGLTLAQVINKWAPPSENDTQAYINNAIGTVRRLGGTAGANDVVVRNGAPQASGVVALARTLLGTPYQLGGLRAHPNDPRAGLDCSEFTAYVYAQQGVRLPWNAQEQYKATRRVAAGDVQVGDLVFFQGTDASNPNDHITHVGIYIGNGRMIDAEDGGVMEADITTGYWRQHIAGYGRVQ